MGKESNAVNLADPLMKQLYDSAATMLVIALYHNLLGPHSRGVAKSVLEPWRQHVIREAGVFESPLAKIYEVLKLPVPDSIDKESMASERLDAIISHFLGCLPPEEDLSDMD